MRQNLLDQIEKFPSLPGVYLMRDSLGAVLYVGKAKNLKQRVRHYFLPGGDGRAMVPLLLSKTEQIDALVVSSEKEALLLENNLIKEHRPRYNALLKDDKAYAALCIKTSHDWPSVTLKRYRNLSKKEGLCFGPYTSAYEARELLERIQRIFPLRECSDEEFLRRTRPCILYEMKRCLAPCVGKCSKEEYQEVLDQVVDVLKGKDRRLLKRLHLEMQQASDALEFERAARILKTVNAIDKMFLKQHVDNPYGKDTDVLGLYREGGEAVMTRLVIKGGKLLASGDHLFHQTLEEDEELISSFLLQRYLSPRFELPDELLLPLKLKNAEELAELLSCENRKKIALKTALKGKRRALLEMAQANARAAFFRKKDQKTLAEKTLLEMQETLHLTNFPRHIECIDCSNLAGADQTASLVAFVDGEKSAKNYRHYRLSTKSGFDDYSAVAEVVRRRCSKAHSVSSLPDLLLIDGGKGHLNAAVKEFKKLNIINVDLISLSKEEGRHDKGLSRETIWLQDALPLKLPERSSLLFLLQKIRDEAHRFALAYQKKRRTKTLFKSELDEIPGIGTVKKRELLKALGSLKKIKEADLEQLENVPKLSKSDARTLWIFFHGK